MKRNRLVYLVLIILVIILGLASRKLGYMLPEFISKYSGDTLWALMVFLIMGFIFKDKGILSIACYAIIFSVSIEISQLYHGEFIDSIRGTRIGGLVLGYGFLWSDITCYITGIVIGVCGEYYIYKNKTAGI
ncbi:ribosomal maturation YjgA family protein [Oceanirhabdus sp. W0125-5]|uniref:ribosomal maturation YjgA family protein n=1 Tax=Oceanirhabdus sp. W0125-5 TaxID=2999116 RepID=UPI003FA59EA9